MGSLFPILIFISQCWNKPFLNIERFNVEISNFIPTLILWIYYKNMFSKRLSLLRTTLASNNIDAYFALRNDPHNSEFLWRPKRSQYLTCVTILGLCHYLGTWSISRRKIYFKAKNCSLILINFDERCKMKNQDDKDNRFQRDDSLALELS